MPVSLPLYAVETKSLFQLVVPLVEMQAGFDTGKNFVGIVLRARLLCLSQSSRLIRNQQCAGNLGVRFERFEMRTSGRRPRPQFDLGQRDRKSTRLNSSH